MACKAGSIVKEKSYGTRFLLHLFGCETQTKIRETESVRITQCSFKYSCSADKPLELSLAVATHTL